MKPLLVLGLVFGTILSFTNQVASSSEWREEGAARVQNATVLQVTLNARKRFYKRTDQLKLDVMLTNSGKEDVYIFGTLDWGYSASFVLKVRDASGKEVTPLAFFDDLTYASPDDNSAFVKLLPNHFLGTNFFAPLDVLNLNKPGRYAIFVQYHSPIPTAEVKLKPFFGRESGTLKSNVVWIEVVR